jgi:hypothetical protein
MQKSAHMVLGKVALGVASAAGLYAIFLGILLRPPVQRLFVLTSRRPVRSQ